MHPCVRRVAFAARLYPYSLRCYSFFKGAFFAIWTTWTSDDNTAVVILNQVGIDVVYVAVDAFGLSHSISLSYLATLSSSDLNLAMRSVLFLPTLLKIHETSGSRDPDCLAASRRNF